MDNILEETKDLIQSGTMDKDYDGFRFLTDDVSSIQTLMYGLKEISGIPMCVSPDKIKISTKSTDDHMYTNVELLPKNFIRYDCNKTYNVGFSPDTVNSLIVKIGQWETLEFIYDRKNYKNDLFLKITSFINGGETQKVARVELNDLTHEERKSIEIETQRFGMLQGSDFVNGITRFKNLDNDLNKVFFSMSSRYIRMEMGNDAYLTGIKYECEITNYKIKNQNEEEGESTSVWVSLKALENCIKCFLANDKTMVSFYMSNGQPLQVVADVGTLGTIKISILTFENLDEFDH